MYSQTLIGKKERPQPEGVIENRLGFDSTDYTEMVAFHRRLLLQLSTKHTLNSEISGCIKFDLNQLNLTSPHPGLNKAINHHEILCMAEAFFYPDTTKGK
ncbi:hypothetical protein [Pantoea rodasii]|uniref:hypothetical protein n=1 Tax=Pantoea rodasii TaxID=1076549 RepID=UPI000FFBDC84|nr:hypothetical protein [Pantoea rodasii]